MKYTIRPRNPVHVPFKTTASCFHTVYSSVHQERLLSLWTEPENQLTPVLHIYAKQREGVHLKNRFMLKLNPPDFDGLLYRTVQKGPNISFCFVLSAGEETYSCDQKAL